MAFHAIKAGEGDTYISAGVEAVSRAGRGSAQFEFHPLVDGSEGSLYNVYIPMGMTAENVAERTQSLPRGPGRVGAHLPDACGRGAGERPLRQGNHSGHRARAQRRGQGGQRDRRARDGHDQGRRAATGHDDGEARFVEAGVQAGRDGHRGQRLPAQRRRCRSAGDVRREGLRARPAAEGPHHRLDGRRDSPGGDGPRPDPGDQTAPGEHGQDNRGHRRCRDQRGLRRPDRALHGRAGDHRRASSTRSAARSPSVTPSG